MIRIIPILPFLMIVPYLPFWWMVPFLLLLTALTIVAVAAF